MAKLNLIVADSDESYLEGLVSFIMRNYPDRFQVSSFTNILSLCDFLSKSGGNVDILLVSDELYSNSEGINKAGLVIMLSEGKKGICADGIYSINKYQRGDKLVANVCDIFSEKSAKIFNDGRSAGNPKVIAVFSPEGGAGKTCVSICSSIQCAAKGLSVFYLNFESFSSTPAFFNCESSPNFSNVIYYLKEGSKNLDLKIEGIKHTDEVWGVSCFPPPDSTAEINEMSAEDIRKLIESLRNSGAYNMIFVDMSSELSSNNIQLLEMCDEIFLVVSHKLTSLSRLKSLKKELDILAQRENRDIYGKICFVFNRIANEERVNEFLEIIPEKAEWVMIPEIDDLDIPGIMNIAFMDNGFTKGVKHLVDKYVDSSRR